MGIKINISSAKKGFTMLEILLVVAMIAILAGIVIFAINPGKQLAEARNAQRRVDVNTILNAVYQYTIDNNGILPTTISSTDSDICIVGAPVSDCSGMVDLQVLTTNEKYLTAIPKDPGADAANNQSHYHIFTTANNRVTVTAPYAELGAVISVTR